MIQLVCIGNIPSTRVVLFGGWQARLPSRLLQNTAQGPPFMIESTSVYVNLTVNSPGSHCTPDDPAGKLVTHPGVLPITQGTPITRRPLSPSAYRRPRTLAGRCAASANRRRRSGCRWWKGRVYKAGGIRCAMGDHDPLSKKKVWHHDSTSASAEIEVHLPDRHFQTYSASHTNYFDAQCSCACPWAIFSSFLGTSEL
jgi:hypothetical protein